MKLDLHYLFSAKYAKWIIISLVSLFSLLIIAEYASLFFSKPKVSLATEPALNKIQPKKEEFNALLNTSLFGVYMPADLNENNIKKSMLDVTLVGILFSEHTEDSQVIIRSASGEEKNYKVGDTIPGDAMVKRIMPNGVVVEHNGTLESLSLPKNDLTFEPVAQPLKEE